MDDWLILDKIEDLVVGTSIPTTMKNQDLKNRYLKRSNKKLAKFDTNLST